MFTMPNTLLFWKANLFVLLPFVCHILMSSWFRPPIEWLAGGSCSLDSAFTFKSLSSNWFLSMMMIILFYICIFCVFVGLLSAWAGETEPAMAAGGGITDPVGTGIYICVVHIPPASIPPVAGSGDGTTWNLKRTGNRPLFVHSYFTSNPPWP